MSGHTLPTGKRHIHASVGHGTSRPSSPPACRGASGRLVRRRQVHRPPPATFDASDTWVPHPYHAGVALIGDARDSLCAQDDWETAGHAYADAHDRYYQVIHTLIQWYTALYMERGPEVEARRARALPLQAEDRSRVPDVVHSGPEMVLDEAARRRFFGEE